MELRHGARYPVRLACSLSQAGSSKTVFYGETLNMSSHGMLISLKADGAAQTLPGEGQLALVVVELPQAPYSRECLLDCACRVVRVEDRGDSQTLALEVKRHYFRPAAVGHPALQ